MVQAELNREEATSYEERIAGAKHWVILQLKSELADL